MIINHVMNDSALPRLVGPALQERLRVMPAVVMTGARQTGKSTLVQELNPGERRYASLDDLDVLDAAGISTCWRSPTCSPGSPPTL